MKTKLAKWRVGTGVGARPELGSAPAGGQGSFCVAFLVGRGVGAVGAGVGAGAGAGGAADDLVLALDAATLVGGPEVERPPLPAAVANPPAGAPPAGGAAAGSGAAGGGGAATVVGGDDLLLID